MQNKIKLMIGVIVLSVLAISLSVSQNSDGHDHSEYFFDEFETGSQVTEACMMCHEDVAVDFMKTRHWNWEGEEFEMEGHGMVKMGKKNLVNNFCIAVPSNYARCTSCHPGYGWEDATFDFTKKENIDCLVCHDQTGTYKKIPTGAGKVDPEVNLLEVAKNVGKTSVETCGACHFNGGGGAAVKHGDLDPALLKADKDVDVHIGGLGFTCTDCHTTESHKISGASHGSMAQGVNHISCTNCHETDVHKNPILNRHTDALACETCHVPYMGKNMASKTYWDWSTAGTKEEVEKDDKGRVTYMKKKGGFKWEEDVYPDYQWYDGSAEYYMIGDKINPDELVLLNELNGDITDRKSKIFPFKKMLGKQPYDKVNNTIIIPKLFGKGGYWKTFDWVAASELGMKEVGQDFSGEVGFTETAMYWPLNHGVSPSKDAVKCMDCHNNGDRMDWEALGYPGDPMRKKGRERNDMLKD